MSCNVCETVVLAENSTCRIQGCTCGVINFTSGGLTLRISMDSFLEVSMAVEEAAMKLVQASDAVTEGQSRKLESVH